MIEIIVNGVGIAIAAFLYIFSRDFSVSKRAGVPSAAFFPTIIAVVLLFLGVYNIVKYFIAKKKGNVEASEKMSRIKLLQFLSIIALMLLYAVLWNYRIGHFILNTIVCFIPVCWLISEETEWWKSAIYIVGLTIFIYFLFSIGLKVRIW